MKNNLLLKNIKKAIKNNYFLYKLLSNDIFSLKPVAVPEKYPTDISIELTSLCNSKCTFCTHEKLVNISKSKVAKHMEYDYAITIINKIRELIDQQNIPDKDIRLAFNGLGEPLLYPHFFEVIEASRKLFPEARFSSNTNCIALDEKTAERLVNCGLNDITLSLAFNDAQSYKKWIDLDRYDLVVKNITYFLKTKGNRIPEVNLYIFDQYMNRNNFSAFMKQWRPLLNSNDSYHIRKLLSLFDWSYKPGIKYPCHELWSLLIIDINGHVYPCCPAIWTDKNEELRLGHILNDSTKTLLTNLNVIRERHINGDFGICDCCSVLIDNKSLCKRAYSKAKKFDVLKFKV